ncbi:MAG TPA: thioredoxin domain-containing protein [Rhodocyclaceae bacterium]|nr:thioredoxin domain-containing protein [Rhodocyclaceae bacterium]
MPNRLAGETSPYLLQHARNPVHWQPWDEQALAQARVEDKPILLSIGYSACHWCHVMAHESFEDPAVAAVMNRLFVNIKVDREERPDLDQIYQAAQQMLTGRTGGWPLTLFLTPDGTPFYGGTYFPKTPRHRLPGFPDLCERVAATYASRRDGIAAQNEELREAMQQTLPQATEGVVLDAAPLRAMAGYLLQVFDPRFGGFGGAPKFPHPTDLDFLLRRAVIDGNAKAGHAALFSLERMARGGIFDQIGGGYCRYSVDERWEIPHFEKMLYDNGPLLALHADAWQLTGDPLHVWAAEQTAGWVMREMQTEEGGYASSLDADSEGEEGKYYVWDRRQVRGLLNPDEWRVAAPHWGLDSTPNFESHWHLQAEKPIASQDLPLLESARHKLFIARGHRMRPGRDGKILTSWNALMIAGMARASRVFGRSDWLDSARRALDFIRKTLWVPGPGASPGGEAPTLSPPSSGRGVGGWQSNLLGGCAEAHPASSRRLLASYKSQHAHLNGYLDDHAFLLAALLELMQADFRVEDLDFARQLADTLLDAFEDREQGGFYFTRHDHEALLVRPKPAQDSATPSGNGVAAQALQRLGHLLGEPRYLDAARRTLALFAPQLREHPVGCASLLLALEEHLTPPNLVILRGPAEALSAWQAALARKPYPNALVLAVPNGMAGLPDVLAKPENSSVNAWLCSGVNCLPPISTTHDLLTALDSVGKMTESL